MKQSRVFIAAAVLCGVLLLTFWSAFAMKRSCGRLIAQTERIAVTADISAQQQEIAALEQLWRKESRRMDLFLPRQQLMDLNEAIFRLQSLSAAESDSLQVELSAIAADLRWIGRSRKDT